MIVVKILKKDFLRKKIVTFVVFAFILLSALLVASGTKLIVELSNALNTLFATAQSNHVFVYDNAGVEIHRLEEHNDPFRLEFLPHHWEFLECLNLNISSKYSLIFREWDGIIPLEAPALFSPLSFKLDQYLEEAPTVVILTNTDGVKARLQLKWY